MKGLDALIRLHRWRLDEKRRELAELERLEDQLLDAIRRIDAEVAAEQAFAQQANMQGISFGGFAAGIIERRKRLTASMAEIKRQMDAKTEEVAEVFRELKRYEIARDQRLKREKVEADRRDQAALDEISIVQHQRNSGI